MNLPVQKIAPAHVTLPRRKVTSLIKALEAARAKIREDLFRFRTCCADPRASK
jgi:hypothetical protein